MRERERERERERDHLKRRNAKKQRGGIGRVDNRGERMDERIK